MVVGPPVVDGRIASGVTTTRMRSAPGEAASRVVVAVKSVVLEPWFSDSQVLWLWFLSLLHLSRGLQIRKE